MNRSFRVSLFAGAVSLFSLSSHQAQAAPMQTQPAEITDGSGRVHRLLLHGDEFMSWMSDLDGYPVERGPDGLFRYVRTEADGSWSLTPHLLGVATPAALGLKANPAPDPAAQRQGRDLRARFTAPPPRAARAVTPQKPSGSLHALVIPVSFSDVSLSKTQADFQAFFDGPFRNYYREVSDGKLDLTASVMKPLRLPRNALYYAWNSYYPARPAWEMFFQSFRYYEDTYPSDHGGQSFDFTQFDQNGDGYADLVIIIHAGKGREQTGDNSDLHSHFMPFSNISGYPETVTSHDGIKFHGYVTVPEIAASGAITPLGVAVHESGHYFGLPDLYDTGSKKGVGLGEFCLMSGGMWLGETPGDRPAHPSAWCKASLGWRTPQKLTLTGAQRLEPIQNSDGRILRIDTSDDAKDPAQYFLAENRTKSGFDALLPGSGLLIYHVDEGQFPAADKPERFSFNTDSDRYSIDLEQADGRRELNTTSKRGDATDPFPTADNTEFTPVSSPSSLAYGAASGNVALTNIRRSGSDILFDFGLLEPMGNGAACTRDAECRSGICAGVCCEDNCTGQCDRICAAERTACPLPSGTPCDDGNACTQDDRCEGGTCVGGSEKICPVTDSGCALSSFCDARSGSCFMLFADDGTACVPGSGPVSEADRTCSSGRGTCQNGTCVPASDLDGIPCEDGDKCTLQDACLGGRCVSGQRRQCPAPSECHLAAACDAAPGECPVIPAFEGTACSGGTCRSGACVKEDGDGSGCGCDASPGSSAAAGLLALASMAALRRRSPRTRGL